MSTKAERDAFDEMMGFPVFPRVPKVNTSVSVEEKQGLTDNALIHHGEKSYAQTRGIEQVCKAVLGKL